MPTGLEVVSPLAAIIGALTGKKKSGAATNTSGDSGSDSSVPGYKRGGKVKKTGMAQVHKGERVLTRRQASKLSHRGRAR